MDIGPAIGIAIGMAITVGLVNAFFCILVGIDSFIMTLGMGTILAGIVLWISNSNSYTGLSDWLVVLITNRDIGGLPFSFYIAVGVCLIVWLVFEFTPIGRQHLFVGKSREVSKLNGIAVGRVRTLSFVSCSVLAAVAGIMYAGAAGGVDPTSALTMLLPAFAAAFLGSTTIMPGQFNPWGAFLSVYFLVTGITGPRHPRTAHVRAELFLRWRTHHCRVACPAEQNRPDSTYADACGVPGAPATTGRRRPANDGQRRTGKMAEKDIQVCFNPHFDAVSLWLGSFGGADSPCDISRGVFLRRSAVFLGSWNSSGATTSRRRGTSPDTRSRAFLKRPR